MNMVSGDSIGEAIEQVRIQGLVSKSIVARDSGHWERLAECYHPEAILTTSWFTGTPAEFVKGSQSMKIARNSGESQKHVTSNFWIEVNENRAVSECDMILYQRRLINEIEFDFSTWSRRLDLLERSHNDWKIWRVTVIYEKDRIDSARPGEKLEEFYRSMDLSRYPAQIKYHCWRNDTVGFPPSASICLKDSEREKAVRAESRRWLAGE